jgi:Flp pilus assembly protein TadD
MKLSQLNAEAALITAPITAPSAAPAVKVPPSAASTQTATASSAPAGGLAPPVARDVVTITNVAPRTVAAEDTIRSARAFWADGAKSAAMTTLRDSLSVAEAARNAAAAALLAREIARLDIAENRSQTALDLLKRLESLVGDDADVWALRGNAEQRLGMHAEAAESYLAALRLRPTEAKWMLGAAISMAANGKPDEARVWAERAAERGAVSPTIANYLRQLGVTLR